jgi:hypothetical protein
VIDPREYIELLSADRSHETVRSSNGEKTDPRRSCFDGGKVHVARLSAASRVRRDAKARTCATS